MKDEEDIKITREQKGWRELFENYAGEYVREGVSLIKRLRLAITLVAFGWLAFLLVLAVLLIMALAQ